MDVHAARRCALRAVEASRTFLRLLRRSAPGPRHTGAPQRHAVMQVSGSRSGTARSSPCRRQELT